MAEGKVQIVDESTGRVMADRAWERGLHQMIEAKEGLAASGERADRKRESLLEAFEASREAVAA